MYAIIEWCGNRARFIILAVLLLVFVLDITVFEHLLMCLLELVHENVVHLTSLRVARWFLGTLDVRLTVRRGLAGDFQLFLKHENRI